MARRGRAARLQQRAAAPPQVRGGSISDAPSLRDQTTVLTTPLRAEGRILLIACGALAREILAIKAQNSLTHLDLHCLPAKLHLYPDQIVTAMQDAVANHRARYETIYVVYADCGTGGQLAEACQALGVEMIPGPHCYSFFEGNDAFSQATEDGEISAFYLTDFLVRQFDAFVWRPMGLDKNPELRDVFFGNYTKLVYQSQILESDLIAQAEMCAQRLGLVFEHRHTGYGDLETTLTRWGDAPAQQV